MSSKVWESLTPNSSVSDDMHGALAEHGLQNPGGEESVAGAAVRADRLDMLLMAGGEPAATIEVKVLFRFGLDDQRCCQDARNLAHRPAACLAPRAPPEILSAIET